MANRRQAINFARPSDQSFKWLRWDKCASEGVAFNDETGLQQQGIAARLSRSGDLAAGHIIAPRSFRGVVIMLAVILNLGVSTPRTIGGWLVCLGSFFWRFAFSFLFKTCCGSMYGNHGVGCIAPGFPDIVPLLIVF